jgi:hypothetical protein
MRPRPRIVTVRARDSAALLSYDGLQLFLIQTMNLLLRRLPLLALILAAAAWNARGAVTLGIDEL